MRWKLMALIALMLVGCADAPRTLPDFVGRWTAEFSQRPRTQVVYGTIVFDSVATFPRGEVRLLGSFRLDSAKDKRQTDLVIALFGGPDPCVESPGEVMAYQTSADYLEIEFTPNAADCGLVGRVSAVHLSGGWQEPAFSGHRTEGELRISPNRQDVDIVGSWRGTSTCVDKVQFPACKDEQVIYDVRRKGSAPDTVTIRADKVVNGVREFMAEFDYSRAPDSSWVATYENPRIRLRIVLRVRGSHMTGVLTDEPSGRRVRDIAVTRVP